MKKLTNLIKFGIIQVGWVTLRGSKLFAHKDIVDQRYKICKSCDLYDQKKDQCTECGCLMGVKTKFLHATCPKEYW